MCLNIISKDGTFLFREFPVAEFLFLGHADRGFLMQKLMCLSGYLFFFELAVFAEE
jgi:oligoribonuclease (3'-5' exoribonuclease)